MATNKKAYVPIGVGGGTFLCAAEEAVIMFEGRETENGRGGGRGTGGRDPAEFSPSLDVCDGILEAQRPGHGLFLG